MTDKPTYITTAISYPNGKPHIGHAYEAITTDAIARYHRLSGRKVRFLTGTDEHGLKMMQTARDAGVTPKQMADQNSQSFKDMCNVFDISHDRFIRTTDADHYEVVTELWRRMAKAGDIYLGRYEGWYSIRDEAYYADDEITIGKDGVKRSPHGTPVEWTVEESYFFRLSKYKERLLDYIQNNDFIQPPHRKNEILSFLAGELRDLSVSRASFDWGVPVPDCADLGVEHVPGHVMYVWVDALANYLTGVSGGSFDERVAAWAACDTTHIIGKDIVRFHTVYWPAFLMSANIPLPKTIFGHGFLLNRGEKMSKSLGNVVDPIELAERFGVDAVRWYMLRKVSFGEDGGYSAEDIVQTYNADLANSFGNLVQRVFSFIAKNLEGRVPVRGEPTADDRSHLPSNALPQDPIKIDTTTGDWLVAVYRANQYVDTAAPWALKKTDPVRMETVLANLLEIIRALAVGCQPFIPTSAAKVLAMFGKDAFDTKHIFPSPLVGEGAGTRSGVAGEGGSATENSSPSPSYHPLPQGERESFSVSFDAISDTDWYTRWAASGFIIQPPTPIFPRLEMPTP
jgi:methionyl-tRNA synthetase